MPKFAQGNYTVENRQKYAGSTFQIQQKRNLKKVL